MTDREYIRFADRFEDAILAGEKRSTVRLEFDRDHAPGDQVDLVDEDDAVFATARVATVGEMTAVEYVRQDHDHHRNYNSLAEFFDELREFYPNADLYPGVRVHVIHFQDVEQTESRSFATDGGTTADDTGGGCGRA